jgi:hypothetical protein
MRYTQDISKAVGSLKVDANEYSMSACAATVQTALQSLKFTPATLTFGSTETATIDIKVMDTHFGTATTSVNVQTTSLDNAPIFGSVPSGQTVHDTETIQLFSGITVSDPDIGDIETVTVTNNSWQGTFSNTNGWSYDAGTNEYSMSACAATVQTALQSLKFTPATLTAGSTMSANFSIKVTDAHSATAATNVVVNVSCGDRVPTIGGTIDRSPTVLEGSSVALFKDIMVSDPDAGDIETVTVTNSSRLGTFSNTAGWSYDADANEYSMSACAATVQTALQSLKFTPATLTFGSTETATIDIKVMDTHFGTATTSVNVQTTSLDNAPIFGSVPSGQTVHDTETIQLFSGITVSDPDIGDIETVTVTNNSWQGTFSNTNGWSYDAGTNEYSMSACAATVQTALQSLKFTPATLTAGSTMSANFSIKVTDAHSATAATNVVVNVSCGDRVPTIGGTIDRSPTVLEGSSVALFKDIMVSDPDAGDIETVTVTNSSRLGTFSNTAGWSYDAGANEYSMSACAATVQTALQSLKFTPATLTFGSTETATINIKVTDSHLAAATSSVAVNITLGTVPNSPAVDDKDPNSVDNRLDADKGNNQLWGAGGNDILTGGAGNDTYWFGKEDGQDVIAADQTNSQDSVLFYNQPLASISSWLSSNDLVISLDNSNNTLTVQDWALGGGYQLNSFIVGGESYHVLADGVSWKVSSAK